MKALIEKLANGNIEYLQPEAELSEKKLELVVAEGDFVETEFSVDSVNDRDIKGVVYSRDQRIEIINNQFFGKHNTIKVHMSAKYLKAGTEMDSSIVVATNAGEMDIPISVSVTPVEMNTIMGKVVDLNDFNKLVSYDYEEALKFFLSRNFRKYILKDDTKMCTLYERLLKNANREIAMEEFLVALNLKKQIEISIDTNKKEYRNIRENYGDVLPINRSTVGYVDIDVEIEGDILYNAKTKITNDDFAGNTYEYPYLINSLKLHQGDNYAKIRFKTTNQTIEFEIIVHNKPNDVLDHISHRRDIMNIMRSYIDFRCGKISGNKWIKDMDELSGKMLKKDEKDMVAVLLKTQTAIVSGDEDKALYMLTRLSHLANNPERVEYYCYYLYLKTLLKKNTSFTEDIKQEIKSYFENGYDRWGLLWIILYLDERFTQNPSLKYTLIKEQYNKGCISPVMYYEAISVLNEEPALLRIINPFELQVLNFGAKMGIIGDKLIRQLVILLEREKNTSGVMLRLLMKIYNTKQNDEVLESICRMLINGGKYGEQYLDWYEKGVAADLKVAQLMEYYVMSVANKGYVILKPSVYMYFGFNAQGLGEYQAYLFANIISNKDKLPKVYDEYKNVIKKYAVSRMVDGDINLDLMVIYKEIITKDFEIDDEIKIKLPKIVNSYEITVDNVNLQEVIICHQEIDKVYQTTLVNNRAIVEIYTENPIIVFIDNKGRRLVNISYKLKKILDVRHLKNLSEQVENKFVDICKVNDCMENPMRNKNKGDVIKKVWNSSHVSKHYKNNLASFVVDYCTQNYDGGELEDFILEIAPEILDHDKRNKLIELLIRRNNIPKATSYINKYGYFSIDKGLLLTYVNEMLKNESADADERLLNLCQYLFVHNKFDSSTLSYLRKYYVGPTDEMYDMWKACRSNGVSDMLFAERLIVQMIFEQRNENRMLELFIAFHCNESGRNIKKAFFTYFSYIYFNSDKSADKEFFRLLEEDMIDGMRVSEICKMAYLNYITKQEEVSKEQIKLCKDLIYELTEINIVFEFYKDFGKWFRMPYSILDKTIIDYRTNPKNKVFITYRVYDEEGKVGDVNTEEMSSVYPGIFVKKLTLFYGEKVVYTIVDKDGDEDEQLKEHIIQMTRKDAYNEDNKFGQINGMLISQELGRGDALDELMKNYEFNRQASEELFKLL